MTTRRDVFSEVEFSTVVGVAEAMRGEVRAAGSTQEAWAMRALVALTADCDGARAEDGVGFNKADTGAGRYLGHYVGAGGKLDDVEWSAAIEMLQKYHGQIGHCPKPDDLDRARRARVQALSGSDGFRDRLKTVHGEAKRVQRERDRVQRERDREVRDLAKRLRSPEVTITLDSGERWIVYTPYNEGAVAAWRDLHRSHGGRWVSATRSRVVPYRSARALHALLVEHHAGEVARGPKGVFVVGRDGEPFAVTSEEDSLQRARALLGRPEPETQGSEPETQGSEPDTQGAEREAEFAAAAAALFGRKRK